MNAATRASQNKSRANVEIPRTLKAYPPCRTLKALCLIRERSRITENSTETGHAR